MKSVQRIIAVLVAGAVTVLAVQRDVSVTFSPGTSGSPVIPGQMNGTCLPIWNSKDIYRDIRQGLVNARYSLLRFPNGSLSNDYHWNGNGGYTGDGIWICDSTDYEPGFMSQLTYRGTSKNHYGFEGASAITDGDTTTMWWSDPELRQSRPYCYLEFTPSVQADSIVIYWGRHHGVDFVVQRWNAPGASYPGPYQAASNIWITVDSVIGAPGGVYSGSLDSGGASGYFRVLVTTASGDSGWQVREVYLYNKDSLVSRNVKSYTGSGATGQTRVVALGTHPGSEVRPDWSSGWVTWDFETFMAYCDSFPYEMVPVICVNFGTGTPQEAAQWVYYANRVKNHGIRFWQVGNEMDGSWEEAGPVDAAMYAEKFLMFSRAMKAVDSTIKVFGPVLSTADFYSQASGAYDDLTWMESFLKRVGDQERHDSTVYLDGIDFHTYPYYFSGTPNPAVMLERSDLLRSQADTLRAMMERRLEQPDSLYVCLSEFNMSVVMASLLQQPANGICVANLYATLAHKFGPRAMSVVWDSYENLSKGPGGTWGSLSLFSPPSAKALSNLTRPPSAIYWPLLMTNRLWLRPDQENRLSPVTADSASKVRAFGVAAPGTFRALLLNLSTDTVRLNYTMNDSTYDEVDVYAWSSREFSWNGSGSDAFAMPNCGPSSLRAPADSVDTLVLLPLSCVVAAWHDRFSDTLFAPELLHSGRSAEKVRGSDSLRLWGTALVAGNSTIERMTVRIDTTAAITLSALDGSADGPSESWFHALRAQDIGLGEHVAVIQVETSGGETVSDTFRVIGGDTLRPVLLIDDFEDRDLVCALPSKASWNKYHAGTPASYLNLGWDSTGASGSATALRADFSIEQPATLPYDVYGSVFLNIDTTFMDTARPAPMGITFTYASKNSTTGGTFILQVQSTPVKDYDYFTIPLANTNGVWRTVTMEWTDIRQEGWGAHIDSLPAGQIRRLEFRTVKGGEGFLSIDNLAFISDSGGSILPVVKGKRNSTRMPLTVLPGPCGRVGIAWNGMDNHQVKVSIFNVRGVLVHSSSPLPQGMRSYVWQRSAAGVYVVRVQGGNKMLERKFLTVR
ncbi:MAG: T9SS type A sorting domain-containing protein [Chitinispirillaceae bacterium]|nr:T9SS type A sorting domain-containing protein [Chitinispirillaceae bacterium]